MTINEAIQSQFDFKIDNDTLDKAVIDQGLKGSSNYDKSLRKPVELAVADLCNILIAKASVKEGGLSISYNPNQLKDMRTGILRKYGIDDETEGCITGEPVW